MSPFLHFVMVYGINRLIKDIVKGVRHGIITTLGTRKLWKQCVVCSWRYFV